MIDHDTETFTIWQANPTSSKELVPVLDQKSSASCGTNNTGSSNGPSKSPPKPTSSSGLSTGTIVGIVVGVIALLAIAAIVAFFIIRHRKSRARSSVTAMADPVPSRGEYYRDDKPKELHNIPMAVNYHEADGRETAKPYAYNAPVHEMDGTSRNDPRSSRMKSLPNVRT
jgi:hypothetical protein